MATAKRKRTRIGKKSRKIKLLASKHRATKGNRPVSPRKTTGGVQKISGPTYDPKSGRWKLAGRYVKAPTPRSVRRDSVGRPIDGKGRQVPAAALSPGRSPSKPKASPKARPSKTKSQKSSKTPKISKKSKHFISEIPMPVFEERPKLTLVPDPERGPKLSPRIVKLEAGTSVVQKEFNGSNFVNRGGFQSAGEILSNTIDRISAKKPFEAEDLIIYNFGIKILGPTSIEPILPQLNDILPRGVEIGHSDTRAGTEVYLRLNLSRAPMLIEGARESLERSGFQEFAARARSILSAYWEEEPDWWVWFESDESLYE